ncbi:1,4-dihydroxy-2-naphthoate octaprenyltransferase [Bifidobacterium stellenboschense]|uniref:1,4-dihydroxy-2-naphthoate octaprenyltransferase n=1 Tax=Bifidobacterium stellenboschense TaxID=762211 RepID=A0A087E0M8_9BIFI|nr:1,4-dihydroxy-2-naphthoate octaprenyltransferase [Bifidobacterium stellenboschense]
MASRNQRGSIIGLVLALIGAGSSLVCSLDRYSSTAAAQERPSAMAHTTRLWPRPASPPHSPRACGLAVAALSGQYWLIGVGALCVIAGWFYTGGRHPYGYAGFGELFVFVFFGLVATLGTQFAVAWSFDGFGMPDTWRIAFETPLTVPAKSAAAGWTVWSMLWDGEYGVDGMGILAAVCCGVNAMMLLMVNNLRDIDDDRVHGKRTLAVRLGARGARIMLIVCAAVEWMVAGYLMVASGLVAADRASFAVTGHIGRMPGLAALLLLVAAGIGLALLAGVVLNVSRARHGVALKLAGLNALWFAVAFAALTMIATGAPDDSIAA